MAKKVIVAGSGISGLSMARMVAPTNEVVVLEKASRPGGLIKCDRVEGNLFHRVGGHVFNSKEKPALDWFWQHFDRDTEFLSAKRQAAVWLQGRFLGYPIEDHLYQLPRELAQAALTELLEKNGVAHEDYRNFGDFLVRNFGQTLYDLYFGPYNSKLWNADLEKVPLAWLEGKLPMPDTRSIVLNNVLRQEESQLVHARFYYPVQDGSQFIVNRLGEGLDIRSSTPLSSVKQNSAGKLVINGDAWEADELVYCGDVRELHALVQIDDAELQEALESVRDLLSNGTSNVLCYTDETALSWLYIPETKFRAHRIIYTGNFSETNNDASGRKTCVVEFSGQVSQAEIREELTKLPGQLEPLGFNYEPNSYVIQDTSTRTRVQRLKDCLAPYHIHLLGRFAEWEYHNMDKCISGAMRLKEAADL